MAVDEVKLPEERVKKFGWTGGQIEITKLPPEKESDEKKKEPRQRDAGTKGETP